MDMYMCIYVSMTSAIMGILLHGHLHNWHFYMYSVAIHLYF